MDFRRDGLALPDVMKRVGRLLAAALCLFLVFAGLLASVFIYRGMRYAQIVRDRQQKQAEVYRNLYPGQEAPPNVKSRLKSELTRLAGISGTGLEMPERPSALDSLQQAVASLPPQVRLRIVEMRIDPDSLFVEGQAQSHGDAEIVSRSLSRAGFEMAAPRSENLSTGGVSFILMGKGPGKKDAEGPERGRRAVKPIRTVEVKK
jgi:hypothetical protein